MQYIIAFLLVTGTTFQIAQSDGDQFQNTGVWILPNFSKSISWIENMAKEASDEFINLSYNMKDKLQNVFTISSIPNSETIDGNVGKVQIYTSRTVITPSQDSVTDIAIEKMPPQELDTNIGQMNMQPQNVVTDINQLINQEIMPPQVSETIIKYKIQSQPDEIL
ncbi:uncharacterized protein LOC113552237 [Rhopalosiphum maidis]|uniref:uncharacterized protein LOC113552237 n=1 Tax=Rhopalosiphum maidis TaxID=43146 RepID=UPI000F004335|nr:uncharacterized protein LOC113552237 [Rhopalosiphum maidis]